MIYANVNNVKSKATPDTVGTCPLCESKVISKCGDIKQWHWAHESLSECDSFSEGETDWHVFMKNQFDPKFQEQVIVKDGVKHRADVCVNGTVIEYQHSSISQSEIRAREEFYNSMIWCLDLTNHGGRFKMQAKINSTGRPYYTFHWSHFKKSFCEAKKPIYLHLGKLYFQVKKLYDNGNGWGYPFFKMPFIEHAEAFASNKINPGSIISPTYYIKPCHIEQAEDFVTFHILTNEIISGVPTRSLTIRIKRGYGKNNAMEYIPKSGVLSVPFDVFTKLQDAYEKDIITLE